MSTRQDELPDQLARRRGPARPRQIGSAEPTPNTMMSTQLTTPMSPSAAMSRNGIDGERAEDDVGARAARGPAALSSSSGVSESGSTRPSLPRLTMVPVSVVAARTSALEHERAGGAGEDLADRPGAGAGVRRARRAAACASRARRP